jgi:polyisoprenoid-binding protein YceI
MLTQRQGQPSATVASRRRATGSSAGPGPVRWALRAGIAACALLAAACTTRAPAPVLLPQKPIAEISSGQPGTEAEFQVPPGARAFEIDPTRSIVTVLVYRAGPMARFGHNHVVTSGGETGLAWLGRDLSESGFEIRIPVASLVVDDPAARAAAGEEFAGEVPVPAREGTYRNMTRAEVLDVAKFPDIIVRCASLAGTWEQPVAAADLTIRGVTRRIDVPVELARSVDTLSARGSLRIRQTDFGITPFSVGGGAIQVGDELDLRFEIVAVAQSVGGSR